MVKSNRPSWPEELEPCIGHPLPDDWGESDDDDAAFGVLLNDTDSQSVAVSEVAANGAAVIGRRSRERSDEPLTAKRLRGVHSGGTERGVGGFFSRTRERQFVPERTFCRLKGR